MREVPIRIGRIDLSRHDHVDHGERPATSARPLAFPCCHSGFPRRSKHAIVPDALMNTTRSPSQTGAGELLSLKQPDRRKGCCPAMSRCHKMSPVFAAQHHATMSLPSCCIGVDRLERGEENFITVNHRCALPRLGKRDLPSDVFAEGNTPLHRCRFGRFESLRSVLAPAANRCCRSCRLQIKVAKRNANVSVS